MKKVNWKVYGEALDALQAQFSASRVEMNASTWLLV